MIDTDIAIVGGGLAGLYLARRLHVAGLDFQLFEARDRFGGRIKTFHVGDAGFDLGPSWFWPQQPLINALAAELGLHVFAQHVAGDECYEDELGRVHRGAGFASMAGALRVAGGSADFINGLVRRLPADRLHLNAAVRLVHRDGTATLEDGTQVGARRIVLSIPPRVAAQIEYVPQLTEAQMRGLDAVPTWMGGHAKYVAVYDSAFWREAGLSGDAFSRRGPLAEIHDASAPGGTPAALFGFVGVPAVARSGHPEALQAAALVQLGRIFGEPALRPQQTLYQDWSREAETSSSLDQTPLGAHPIYGLPAELRDVWDGFLHFGSTEMAPEDGGLMEGALARAATVARQLIDAAA